MANENHEKLKGVRIARISTVPFFVVAQLKQQISMLGKCGARVAVVASNEPELSLMEGLDGVTCVPIDIPRSISLIADVLALFQIFRFFRRDRTQIAHSTTPKAGLLTALAAVFARVPVRLHTFTGQPWVTMRGPKRWLAYNSDRLIAYLNTHCYADSASQRQFLIEQGIVNAAQLSVIGGGSLAGVDLRRFDRNRFTPEDCASTRQSLNIPPEVPVLLFLGRITIDKGVRELLQAFSLLQAAGSDAHLVFVGRFDTGSGVSGAISQNDIERIPNTHMAGYSECQEAYIAMADLLCLPSYREGFGTAVIEAAAMGVPTVGTNIYGLSDAIIHGETGLLVPTYNVDDLAQAIGKLLDDRALRLQMGIKAKHRAQTVFDANILNAQVVEEYCSLLAEKKISQ